MKRALVGALGLVATTASAQTPPRLVVDVYDSIGGCPDEAAFRAEVERRVHAWPRAPMHVTVHVTQQPRIIEGTVEVVDANGARATRKVSSTQCAEIVSAAALVTALAIDDVAEAAGTPTATPTPTEQVTPVVAPLTMNTGERDAGRSDELVFRLGVDGAVQVGVVPKPVLSVPLFVELGAEQRDIGFHIEPRARLAWTFAASAHGLAESATATSTPDFTWMSGALDVCPVRLVMRTHGTRPVIDVRACGRFELGRLSAEGQGTLTKTQSEARVWLGAGVPFTGRFDLGGRFFLEAEGGPRFVLVRDAFGAGPANSLAFRPPVVGLAAGIGVGVAFR